MKILILGGGGMLGHKLVHVLSKTHKVSYTARQPLGDFVLSTFKHVKTYSGLDAMNPDSFIELINTDSFDVVINCIGIVKQLDESKNAIPTISVNSLFPHLIAETCAKKEIRFIHISTDCVFSGHKGKYTENDLEDAKDLYGRSKLLGEVQSPSLTLRTSIIGHELHTHRSLIDWFLLQKSGVKGFNKAIYSGMPTIRLAQIILFIIESHPKLRGLYHVSAAPIDKFTLLKKVAEQYGHDIAIIPYHEFQNDKSLMSNRFKAKTNYSVPVWDELIKEMHEDFLHYSKLYLK